MQGSGPFCRPSLDLNPVEVESLRNKLHVRNSLCKAGLSHIKAHALTPEVLETLRRSGAPIFVKPVHGIASYGAFRLTRDTTWEDIQRIGEQIRQDTLYSQVVSSDGEFLAEDYLTGTECSFEVLACSGELFFVGVHEKCEVTEAGRTVLEDSCTSPPVSIDSNAVADGISWVRSVLHQLELHEGCFHVEARFDGTRWDLIEINCRLGGSLISHSVKALNEEAGVLELWLDLLLTGKDLQPKLRRLSYSERGVAPGRNASFFRVYFAKPGRIGHTELKSLRRPPAISQILLRDGEDVIASSREVFLGQLLWIMARQEQAAELVTLLDESRTALVVRYEPANTPPSSDVAPLLLIVDYNLARIADVAALARYARTRHDMGTLLVRAAPDDRDRQLCDYVIDVDPMGDDFIPRAIDILEPFRHRLRAGLVFSDNAVHCGALLLEELGLPVDSATLALGAFSKLVYRSCEARVRDLLESQGVMVPDFSEVRSIEDLRQFAHSHPTGFVVKPSCEGNNRGVVVVHPSDNLSTAFGVVAPYLSGGALCESFIDYRREFSFDGVGSNHFITEKMSATGAYPVEVAQILPARLLEDERSTLTRTGRLANLLVGQQQGPFHNEIKLSDDGKHSAVVEPNRRPAGMKIWTLAEAVFGVDFYGLWVDAAMSMPRHEQLTASDRQAATIMLGVPEDGVFDAPSHADGVALMNRVLAHVASKQGVATGAIRQIDFNWLHAQPRFIPSIPCDNADFAAQACVLLDGTDVDIRAFVVSVRDKWLDLLAERRRIEWEFPIATEPVLA